MNCTISLFWCPISVLYRACLLRYLFPFAFMKEATLTASTLTDARYVNGWDTQVLSASSWSPWPLTFDVHFAHHHSRSSLHPPTFPFHIHHSRTSWKCFTWFIPHQMVSFVCSKWYRLRVTIIVDLHVVKKKITHLTSMVEDCVCISGAWKKDSRCCIFLQDIYLW